MIAKITHLGNIEPLTNYHFKKIEEGVGVLLGEKNMDVTSKYSANLSFRSQSELSKESNLYTHISLNFPVQDKEKVTDEVMLNIANEYLERSGYSEQPMMIVRHNDQEHPHLHIVLSNVKNNGVKVNSQNERYRSQSISRSIEKKYGLTVVSSKKTEEKKVQYIVNTGDYKNYLKQSIDETMRLKPKNKADLYHILEKEYDIKSFESNLRDKKGVSFALVEGDGKRYVNSVGTKAIAGSKVSARFSFNKIDSKIKENYQTAPKRYRLLKQALSDIDKETSFFKTISKSDLSLIFEGSPYKIVDKDNTFLVLDSRKSILYNEYDLKQGDISKKFSEETALNFNAEFPKIRLENENFKDYLGKTLEGKLFFESYELYKNEDNKRLKDFHFEKKFKVEELAKYLESTPTFQKYAPFISEENCQIIFDNFKNNHGAYLKFISAEEARSLNGIELSIKIFCDNNSLSENRFKDIFSALELGEKDKLNYPQGSTVNLIHWISNEIKNEKEETVKEEMKYIPLSSDILFNSNTYFKYSELSEEVKPFYEKAILKSYVSENYRFSLSNYDGNDNLIQLLNERGIEVKAVDKAEGKNYFANFHEHTLSLEIKGFSFSDDAINNQNVVRDMAQLQIQHLLDKGNCASIYYMDSSIKEKYETLLNTNDGYKDFVEYKGVEDGLRQAMNQLKKESGFDYESDFVGWLKDNPEYLSLYAPQELVENKQYSEVYNSFVTPRFAVKEKESFHEKIKTARSYNSKALLALLGVKSDGKNITDFHGKYKIERADFYFDKKLVDLQAEPVFRYYSGLLNNNLKEDVNKRIDSINPDSILMYAKFEYLLNDEIKKDLEPNVVVGYLKHYERQAEKLPMKDRLIFLNSKGIKAEFTEGKTILKLLHFSHSHAGELKVTDDSKQMERFTKHDYSTKEKMVNHISFHHAMDSGNYKSAAWTKRINGLDPLMDASTKDKHGEGVNQAEKEIRNKELVSGVLDEIFKSNPNRSVGRFHGLKGKKKKGKGRRR